MKAIKFFLVVLVLTVFVISPLMAEGYKDGCKDSAQKENCEMMGLNSEHAAELHKLKMKSEQSAIDFKAKIKKIHISMKMELMEDDPKIGTIEKLAEKLTLAKGELHKNKIRFIFDAKKVLSDKERKFFLKKHMQMECGMEDCHKQGIGMHGERRGAIKHHPRHSRGKDYSKCIGATQKGCKSEATPKCPKEIKLKKVEE